MLELRKNSIGVGDRFAHQTLAQLDAIKKAGEQELEITPVWNKSYREHDIIGSEPSETRSVVDEVLRKDGWVLPYHIDADHINMTNVDRFLDHADFYTIDVAEYIGTPADPRMAASFIENHKKFIGGLEIPGMEYPLQVSEKDLNRIADQYLSAMKEAGKIYRYIADQKGVENFIAEVSIDETDLPQTPVELLFILKLLSDEQILIQTIAPKFIGEFHKGVDYVGNVSDFTREFEMLLYIIDYAIQNFGLPKNLKISLHSGSDKFSLYPEINRILKRLDRGLHLKTAGTTWLEEVIGMILSGQEGLGMVKDFYRQSLLRFEELCGPYRSVVDINYDELPSIAEVKKWDAEALVNAIRHDPSHPNFNANMRQLLHIGYKIAAENLEVFQQGLEKNAGIIGEQVTINLYDRHIKPLFIN